MVDTYKTPLLTARDAARHLCMPESTLNVWLASKGHEPLVHSVRPEQRGWPRIPFVGLIEAHVLRILRGYHISMDELRDAAHFLRTELDDEYALASRRLGTDGVRLFVKLNEAEIILPKSRQLNFPEVIAAIEKDIWRDELGDLQSLRLRQYPDEAEVIIDPRFGWGSPVLAVQKVPVDAMVSLWDAGESMTGVAEEFDLTRDVVENVIRAAKRVA